tara:strand:+ start:228 stop:500 length:273 start_codon:yes stop_codon:yes gene_type:complete
MCFARKNGPQTRSQTRAAEEQIVQALRRSWMTHAPSESSSDEDDDNFGVYMIEGVQCLVERETGEVTAYETMETIGRLVGVSPNMEMEWY